MLLVSDKKWLRSYYRERRASLRVEERAQASTAIMQQLIHHRVWRDYQIVHIFLPCDPLFEVNTWPLLHYLWQFQPHIKTTTNLISPDEKLLCCEITEKSSLRKNAFGIEEPLKANIIAAQDIDVMIIPLLACDFYGNRLGYGKAYYDDLLQLCRNDMRRIGVHFFPPSVEKLPAEPHDEKIHALICPAYQYHFCLST